MNEQQRVAIVHRYLDKVPIRKIARDLGVSRSLVQRVVKEWESARDGTQPAFAPRATPGLKSSLLASYETLIQDLLERYPDITAVRVWEELQARGFAGKYSIVRDWVRQRRPPASPTPVVRFETAPGLQAQMDYGTYDLDFTGEGRRRVYLFSFLLGYSRRQYLRFVESMNYETTVREHIRAFEHLGGVPAECLYDNQKVVVNCWEDDQPIYNGRFLSFAAHYGFRPVACRPRRPQTKGKVERPFHYVETSLLNGRTFHTLAHLNQTCDTWMSQTADVRCQRTTGQSPLERHALERPYLLPLPARPFEPMPVIYRCVGVEGWISYQRNNYSVPWKLIGQLLPLRATETELLIYDVQFKEIARQPLFPRTVTGQCCVQPAHRPGENTQERETLLRERFAELGPSARKFLEGLLQQRNGKNQAQGVLALLGTYRRKDWLAALERALSFGAFSRVAVERILATLAQPKSILETLAEQVQPPVLPFDPVPPRAATEYQSLFNPETDNNGQESKDSDDTDRPAPADPP